MNIFQSENDNEKNEAQENDESFIESPAGPGLKSLYGPMTPNQWCHGTCAQIVQWSHWTRAQNHPTVPWDPWANCDSPN